MGGFIVWVAATSVHGSRTSTRAVTQRSILAVKLCGCGSPSSLQHCSLFRC